MLDRRVRNARRTSSPFTSALVSSLAACALLTGAVGCKKVPGTTQMADSTGPDPAAANLASVDPNQPQRFAAAPQSAYRTPGEASRTRMLGQSQSSEPYQQSETYGQQPAPIERAPDPHNYTPPQGGANAPAYQEGDENFDQTIDQYADSAPLPPPPLPVYQQPPDPEPNYLWTPGYWSYAPTGYFWVPGAWCAPPYTGALWTPGYWGYVGNRYRFHRGFWGLHIGFYGGIPYGFGYTGHGYEGGYWNGNNFYYNRAVNRVNPTVHNTYIHNVTVSNTMVNNRVSYNGPGGAQARPAAYEIAAMREQHAPPQAAQVQIRQQAAGDRQQFFNQNHGQPAVAVAQRPLVADHGVAAPPRQSFAQNQNARPEQQGGVQSGFQQPAQQVPGGLNPHTGAAEQQAQPQRFAGQQPRNAPEQEPWGGRRTLNTPQHNQQTGTVQSPLRPQQRGTPEQQRNLQIPPQAWRLPQQQRITQTPQPFAPGNQETPQQQEMQQHNQPQQQFDQRNRQVQQPQELQQRNQQQVQQRISPPEQRTPPQQLQQRAPQQIMQQPQRIPQPQVQQRMEPPQRQQPSAPPHGEAPRAAPSAQPQARPHEERSPR